ncbi:Dirigent protein [Rhynchospora pubera]|uniref:Dirigent protein n=1 Tax=Rhynchospora pubera TaxID=906938 RepID=A0AAV8DY27_9POAL|nr:Dirigent protein [Rhynchospora pubera]KAJ4780993.1 Dirigent protein [Rhynchospora pubera]KAJ4780994.1 Dirigent protein [Rhynchospora pubera]KAJ4780996.1 Dirigent protein [Rhynchospora pubera]
MATFMFSSLFLMLLLCCATNSTLVASSEQSNDYLISSHTVSHVAVEKQSHFRFYWHDKISGRNQTSVRVADAPEFKKSISTNFSDVYVFDDPLRTGPDKNSKLVGRAKGIYLEAGLYKIELLVAMNFVFTDGKYNGSTIAVFGHNEALATVREMPIVGGSGLFRFARGLVQLRTYLFQIDYAVVEYNVFVNHY